MFAVHTFFSLVFFMMFLICSVGFYHRIKRWQKASTVWELDAACLGAVSFGAGMVMTAAITAIAVVNALLS